MELMINKLDKHQDEFEKTIIELIKKCNYEAPKYLTDADIVKITKVIKPNQFACCNEQLYYFNGSIWKENEKELLTVVTDIIRLTKLITKELLNEIEKNKDDTTKATKLCATLKSYNNAINKYSSFNGYYGVKRYIQTATVENDLMKKFNTFQDGIMFDDVLLDFKILENEEQKNKEIEYDNCYTRESSTNDYITKTTNYKFNQKKNEKVREELMIFLNSLFEDENVLNYLLDIMASCLIGHRKFENFYVLTGKGRNGKGALNVLLKKVFGSYLYECDMENFTKKKTSINETNGILAKSAGVRLLIATEPEDDEKLLISRLKQFTGNDIIQAREIYQGSISFRPQFTIFIQCNDIPELSKLDLAIQERIRIIDFPFHFTDDPEPNTNQRKAIQDLKLVKCNSQEWTDEMMHILIEQYVNRVRHYETQEIPKPEKIKIKIKEYIEENNPVPAFIKNNFVVDDKKYIIKNEKQVINRDTWHLLTDITNLFNACNNFKNKKTPREISSLLAINNYEKIKHGGQMYFFIGATKTCGDEDNDDND